MALSEDQRAMLQLLLEREQSYADIAGLLGDEEDEVRTRARAALTEIGGADPDREVALSDYLLGQADPIGRADAARHLKEDGDDRELAEKLIAQLRLIAPEAELPKLPAAAKRTRKPKPVAGDGGVPATETDEPEGDERRATRRLPSLPSLPSAPDQSRARLLVALLAGGVIVLVVVLAIAGVFSGDDEGGSSSDTGSGSETTAEGTAIAQVPLTSVGGGDAAGVATVGQANSDQVYVDLEIRDLEPAPEGKVYFVWFGLGGDRGYPFQLLQMPPSGEFSERYPLQAEYLNVLANAKSVDVYLSDNREVATNIQDAIKKTQFATIPGEHILEGDLTGQVAGSAAGGSGGAAQLPGAGSQPGG